MTIRSRSSVRVVDDREGWGTGGDDESVVRGRWITAINSARDPAQASDINLNLRIKPA